VELVFGVPNHFGKDNETVLHEIADILRHGMLRPAAGAESGRGDPAQPAETVPRA